MDFETVTPEVFGASLRGLGLNLLVRDVTREVAFLEAVVGKSAQGARGVFAFFGDGEQLGEVPADGTYGSHP
ncbi:MAG: glyoxalase, partial [Roseovarius confluentis]